MNKYLEFETYLFINPNKISISVLNLSSLKEFYFKEKLIENPKENLDYQFLLEFLEKNILNIEKNINNFIKEVIVVIDNDIFFEINLSIKNKNFDNNLNSNSLKLLLNESRNQCKETLKDNKIVHMVVNNYIVDNKYYSTLPEEIDTSNFSIDVRFICLSNTIIKSFENSLLKYHISILRFVSANYVRQIFNVDENNLLIGSKKLIDGYNKNEVSLIDKPPKNIGFFEKFFNFFN